MRVLDVGCGWGSFALHAARHYGVDVVGVTLSGEQAAMAGKRVAEAGLTDRVAIRVQDYRDVDDGPFDAISSIGMSEHVGREQMPDYVARLHGLLRPGGRLLNHAISWNAGPTAPDPDSFIPRYVFPDGEMLGLAEMVGALETGGLEVLDVEALRRHYALTLRAWVRNLEEHWSDAVELAGEGRARVWRLYMAASALGFESGTDRRQPDPGAAARRRRTAAAPDRVDLRRPASRSADASAGTVRCDEGRGGPSQRGPDVPPRCVWFPRRRRCGRRRRATPALPRGRSGPRRTPAARAWRTGRACPAGRASAASARRGVRHGACPACPGGGAGSPGR